MMRLPRTICLLLAASLLLLPLPSRARQTLSGVSDGAAVPVTIATPLSFFRMEEASGTRVDSAAGGNDLTPSGTPGNAAGIIGNALSLSGGGSQSVADNTPTGMGLGTGISWTIGLWVRPNVLNAGDGNGVIDQTNISVSNGYDLFINSAGFRAYVGTVSNGRKSLDANGTAPATSTWICAVMKYDSPAKTLTIRVNDATQSTLSTVSDIANPSGAFQIGTEPLDGTLLNARVDNVSYWQSALSSADITAFYNLGLGREYFSGAWH